MMPPTPVVLLLQRHSLKAAPDAPIPRHPLTSAFFTAIGSSQIRGKRQPNNFRSAIVSELTVAEAINRIYESLHADNADIDAHIANLKAALAQAGLKEAVFDPARLVHNNRSGRKLMQAYFRQRGVTVKFSAS
jgi:hypothetical protein